MEIKILKRLEKPTALFPQKNPIKRLMGFLFLKAKLFFW